MLMTSKKKLLKLKRKKNYLTIKNKSIEVIQKLIGDHKWLHSNGTGTKFEINFDTNVKWGHIVTSQSSKRNTQNMFEFRFGRLNFSSGLTQLNFLV